MFTTGAGKRLGLLIEGESMLNDGSAIVLYEILWEMIEGHTSTGKHKGDIADVFSSLIYNTPCWRCKYRLVNISWSF